MAQMGFDNNELQNRDDRLDTILNGTMRSAGNGNFNIGQIATSAEDLVREITEKFEDALAGSSVDDSVELSVLSNIARQLNLPASSEGLASFANQALARLEERAANADGKGENIWSRITEERRRDEREKDRSEELGDYRQNARQAQQQLQAELEEHRRTQHTMGGVTMNGEEWSRFADDIRNDERTRNSMRDYLLRQGVPPKDVDKKLEDYANAAAAMAKPLSQRTPADWAAIRRADNDPNFRGARAAAEAEQARGQDNTQVQTARIAESQNVSIDQRNDLLAGTIPLMEARPSVRLIPDDLFTQSPEEIVRADMKDLRATMSKYPRYETAMGAEPPRNLMVRDSSAEGNVRSDINLTNVFSAAQSATTPLDNPTLVQAQAPRQFAANQTTISTPENVL